MSGREYPIPHVEYTHADGGISPHPPLDQSWSDGQKLAWHAGCVIAETELDIHVFDSHQKTRTGKGPWMLTSGLYSFTVRGPGASIGTSGMDFRTAWSWLNGIDVGARAAHTQKEHTR